MNRWRQRNAAAIGLSAALGCFVHVQSAAGADDETQRQIRQLQQQNESLQQQLSKQQELINELNRKVSGMPAAGPRPAASAPEESESTSAPPGFSLGKIHVSGEGGLGLFESGSHGQSPNAEFRVDEAKLFFEAPIFRDVYFFSELNIFTREENDFQLRAGELYLDVEGVSRLWNNEKQLSLRAGRIDIPFGEEYLTRDAIDNPLISHSIMDFWGVDEGVELYGSFNQLSYVFAVQNGSVDRQHDFNADKAIVGRVSLDPNRWLHLSLSAMRTGDIDVNNDHLSELWLGSGLIHSLGGAGTKAFGVQLLQGDVRTKLSRTTLRASGGSLRYDDDDPAANNRRYAYYYAIEAQQKIYEGLYAAARWSQVFADKGFPIVGNGNVNAYGFGPALTENLSRLSLGVGYRWSRQLVLKAEYTLERGRDLGGARRNHEDQLAAMVAFAF